MSWHVPCVQQIGEVLHQASGFHKTTIQLFYMNLIILYRKRCINCTIVVLHYQFLVVSVRLLQFAVRGQTLLSGLPEMELNCWK